MPLEREPLTDDQQQILQWVADGCPTGVWPDHSHKIRFAVLERRGLAGVRRWYGKWHAVLLPDGRYYLDHGTYPPKAPTAQPDIEATKPCAPSNPTKPLTARASTPTKPRASTLRPSVSQQLVDDILAAGGTLRVELADEQERLSLESRIRTIRRKHLVPEGHQLVVSYVSRLIFELRIEPLPAWMTAELQPIVVLEQLRRPHPLIAALRDRKSLLQIEGTATRSRALRMAQALVAAALKAGYEVSESLHWQDARRRRGDKPGQLRFTVRGHPVELRISQVMERVPHEPTPRELADKARDSWRTYPKWDYLPTDRLKFELTGLYVHRQESWTDTAAHPLETKLPEIFQELGLRADGAERAHQAAMERERQARVRHEEQLALARQRFTYSRRAEALDQQAANWRQAAELQAYIAAVRDKAVRVPEGDERIAIEEWIAWASDHIERLDPLRRPIAAPSDIEPRYSDLQPFMPSGTSVYGPTPHGFG